MQHSTSPKMEVTIFTVMSMLAQEHKAINLSQGFPDFPIDENLIECVSKAMKDGFNQYMHTNGYIKLREEISLKIHELYDKIISEEDEITITPGASYAIHCALTSLLDKGDEVILFEPAYDSYTPCVIVNRAKPIPIEMTFPGFKIPWDEVRKKITTKTKIIIINNPNNPATKILTQKDLQQLVALAREYPNIYFLFDEVYEHIVYDGKNFETALKYEELYQRSFVIYSFGKTFHCTGWKIGYCVAPKDLTSRFRKVHQYSAFSTFTPAQIGLTNYMQHFNPIYKLSEFYQKKRDAFCKKMEATPFKPIHSEGTYFQLYDYRFITEEGDVDFAKRLTKEVGVATIPLSVFYSKKTDNKLLRFCFAKKDETIDAAIERLLKIKF